MIGKLLNLHGIWPNAIIVYKSKDEFRFVLFINNHKNHINHINHKNQSSDVYDGPSPLGGERSSSALKARQK